MKLQEIGFPYKKYNNKFIDRRMDEIVTYHQDNVKQADPKHVLLHEQGVCHDTSTSSLFGKHDKRNDHIEETEIFLKENGYLELYKNLSIQDYFCASDYGDCLMEDYRFEFKNEFIELVPKNLVFYRVDGAITLRRDFPLHKRNLTLLQDGFGTHAMKEDPDYYMKAYPMHFHHMDDLQVQLRFTIEEKNHSNQDFFPTKSEQYIMRKLDSTEYTQPHSVEDLHDYQELREILLTEDPHLVQQFLFQRSQRADVDLELQFLKTGFQGKRTRLHTTIGMKYDDGFTGHYSKTSYTVPETNITLTDDLVKKELGLENLSIEQNSGEIQGKVFLKLREPTRSHHK